MLSKNKIFYLFMLLGVIGITPQSYAEEPANKTSIDEVKKETQELLHALKSYSVEQRGEAVRKTKTALDNLDKRIASLQTYIDTHWDEMDTVARDKARASLNALRKERTKVAEWYGSLKSSSAEAWVHMKKGFSNAYQSLNEAWEEAVKEFR